MKTIREGKLDDLVLRLVEKDKLFIGLVIAGGAKKLQIDGTNADDVWRRLHDEAGKANPKYFGFDGARARFLRFFPNGFHSTGYAEQERDYKVAAKKKLDAAGPLRRPQPGLVSVRRSSQSSGLQICCRLSRRPDYRTCFADRPPTRLFGRPPDSRWAKPNQRCLRWNAC
jgi:hypothetical protein